MTVAGHGISSTRDHGRVNSATTVRRSSITTSEATLMALIIDGIMTQKLHGLVLSDGYSSPSHHCGVPALASRWSLPAALDLDAHLRGGGRACRPDQRTPAEDRIESGRPPPSGYIAGGAIAGY